MIKEYFLQLADYNIWANNKIHSWLEKITEEQWEQPIVSSFKSIGQTVLHVTAAENIWLDRLNGVKMPVALPSVYKGSKKDALDAWKRSSQGLYDFIKKFDEAEMQSMVSYMRPDNKVYELLHYQIFAHVFNHGSYHRGQIITMLRQAGFTDVSSIDLSTYYWSKK
jgi:uncharacterized damage-inducible protein DinB